MSSRYRCSYNATQPAVDKTVTLYSSKRVPTILIRNRETGQSLRVNHDHAYDVDKFERVTEE